MNDFSRIQMKMKIFFWLVHICVGFFLYMSGSGGSLDYYSEVWDACWTMGILFPEQCWIDLWKSTAGITLRTDIKDELAFHVFSQHPVLIQIVLIMQSDDRNSHDLVDTNKVVVCKKNVACNHNTSAFAVSHAPVMSFSQSLIFFYLNCFSSLWSNVCKESRTSVEICSPLAICFNPSHVKASWMASPSNQTVIQFLLMLTEEHPLTSSETLQDASPQAPPTVLQFGL